MAGIEDRAGADVLVSTKRTVFDHNFQDHTYDELLGRYEDDDLQTICESHERHYETLSAVENRLEEYGASYETAVADLSSQDMYQDRELVVSVGGDGTVLETAKYVADDTPVVPIKSDSNSIGGLCRYTMNEAEDAIEDAFEDPIIEEWTRIEGAHGSTADIALNEIFVGVKESTDGAYYTIEHNDEVEQQKSSGVILSTGAGSTGWYKNIDERPVVGTQAFDNDANVLKYAVREPMDASLVQWMQGKTPFGEEKRRYTLRNGVIEAGDEFVIRSHVNDDKDGIVRYDGDKRDRTYDFFRGKELQVRLADQPLHVVTGSES